MSLKGAKGLLLSITGGRDLTLYEVDEAASRVRQEVDPEANIIVGATFDETLGDRVRVSIVASGMARQGEPLQAPMPPPVDPRQRMMRPQAAAPAASARAASRSCRAATRMPQHHAAPDDDMQRRLSDAIGVERRGAAREPQATARDVARARQRRHRGRLLAHDAGRRSRRRARAGARVENGNATGQFIPAPPADLRRGARRMPDVEDFPPVAQREYRAKAGYAPQGGPPPRRNRRRRAAAPWHPAAHHGSRAPRGDGRSADEQCRARSASHIKLVVG